jgi:hypothetical protein
MPEMPRLMQVSEYLQRSQDYFDVVDEDDSDDDAVASFFLCLFLCNFSILVIDLVTSLPFSPYSPYHYDHHCDHNYPFSHYFCRTAHMPE